MSSEAQRLRDACAKVRTSSMPLSDLIPLMQQAADTLDRLAQQAPDQFIQRARDIVKDHDDHAAGRAVGSPVMNLAQFTARAINLARDIAASGSDVKEGE